VRHSTAGQALPTLLYTPPEPPSESDAGPAAEETASGGFIVDAGGS